MEAEKMKDDLKNYTEAFSLPSLQVYQVVPDSCHILKVTVVEAHNITKGWVRDLVDKPDPYIILKIPESLNEKKETKHFDNNSSPIWNESFTFVLDPEKEYDLEIRLMDANYTVDTKLGVETLQLSNLVLNEESETTITFNEITQVVLKLLLTADHNPDLRYGLSLCDEEKEFRKIRQQFVKQSLVNIIPESYPKKDDEVPIVGIVSSGGGFRAMTGLAGAMKALSDLDLIDCVMYAAGLSGSAWYLSTLYSDPSFPEKSPSELLDDFRNNVRHSPFWLLSPRSLYRYISNIKEKHKQGQPVSFTDFFGHLLGDTLLKGRSHVRLSEQKSKVLKGNVPMPLYTCLHVKSNVSAKVFQDWLEFTPFEVGMAKYAAFMKSEDFGCKFFKGRIVKRFCELPLHYLQGVWGSAFCILFKRLIQEKTKLSLDFTSCQDIESDEEDEDEDIFYDAEEEFSLEEDTLRDSLETLDLSCNTIDDVQSENEEETSETSVDGSSGKSNHGYWKNFVNNICSNTFLDTRKGRAGCILNPLRGLSLHPCFSFSPLSPTSPSDNKLFKGLTEPAPTDSKTLFLVDGGLTFNLPFPLLLRPQRHVDLFLTFDFSSREGDYTAPFKELLITEKWAKINSCVFPPIHDLVAEYVKQPPKECYVFKHPSNHFCPVIIHFPLFNLHFRKFKAPGVLRETEDEKEFANFSIFSDPKKSFSIYNFKYPNQKFDRLSKLMEFNVLNNIHIIKEELSHIVNRKKKFAAPQPGLLKDDCRKTNADDLLE